MTTEERINRANEYHNQGFNCCQAVLTAFTDETGLTIKQALALGGGFGGGMRHGEVCGAVSGAVMVMSMTHPYTNKDDADAKKRIAFLTREFHKRFIERFGELTCVALLKRNISTDEQQLKAREDGVMKRCPEFISGAIEITVDILDDEEQEKFPV